MNEIDGARTDNKPTRKNANETHQLALMGCDFSSLAM